MDVSGIFFWASIQIIMIPFGAVVLWKMFRNIIEY